MQIVPERKREGEVVWATKNRAIADSLYLCTETYPDHLLSVVSVGSVGTTMYYSRLSHVSV
jgi:hypothetical protein